MYQEAAKQKWLIFFWFYLLKKAFFFGLRGWLARLPKMRGAPQFWQSGQQSSPTKDKCYFFMMQFAKIEGGPSFLAIWPANHAVQRKMLFKEGKIKKKISHFFFAAS